MAGGDVVGMQVGGEGEDVVGDACRGSVSVADGVREPTDCPT